MLLAYLLSQINELSLFLTRGGYRVIPKVIEFWQGQSKRLHDRIEFRRSNERSENENNETDAYWKNGDDGWIYARLSS